MVNLDIEKISKLMKKPSNIRNLSIIAHVDHGKSTLTDSLVAFAGIIPMEQAGNQRFMDTRKDEQERGITIKSTGISLYYNLDCNKIDLKPGQKYDEFLINLIDSPGHADFSSEVTAALRVTDGALVIVDCIEEVCVQTETVLRQALSERIIPILVINKLDRCFIELSMRGEDAYKSFQRIIENVNVLISTYHDEAIGELNLHPTNGNVCFAAGLHGWAFSLQSYADIISKAFGYDPKKLINKLWGNHFYNPEKKKWTKKSTSVSNIRGFVKFVYEPLNVLIRKCLDDNMNELESICKKLCLLNTFNNYKTNFKGKNLMKKILSTWLPAHKPILETIINFLPSPEIAQKYRTELIYEGPIDDIYSKSMKKCDSEGPLMMYISKMIPNHDNSRFLAFGRVFSGTIYPGLKVFVMGSKYIKGQQKDSHVKSVQRTILCMGKRFESVDSVPCGNLIALVGLDQVILKTATITNENNTDVFPIKGLKFSVHPVVRRAIKLENPTDQKKLFDGLRKLSKSDPLVQYFEDQNETIIAGAGELHLEICLKDLQEIYSPGLKFVVDDPVVPYRESIVAESDHTSMTKSSNKHNRIFTSAISMNLNLAREIEEGNIDTTVLDKNLSKIITENTQLDQLDFRKIWCFGPDNSGSNILIDFTKSVQYLEEIKRSCINAFQLSSREGILMKETMRGVIILIKDVVLHSDSIHRNEGQIAPAFKKVVWASFMTANPRLMEPIFLVEITVPRSSVSGVYTIISNKRGRVFEEVFKVDQPICILKSYLPVSESFGFSSALSEATSGKAFSQTVFDHWEFIQSDPLKDGTIANKILIKCRKRKGLDVNIPKLENLEDKL